MLKPKVGRGARFDVRLKGWAHSNQLLFGHMLLSAMLSLFAAFKLSIDALELAANPQGTLTCDINAVLSCGTVAKSWQAELLGFPNTFIGLMCEPVVITIAVAALAGVKFPRWFMFTANIVYLFGMSFAYWLFYQSAFFIGALCPYCLIITVCTTFVFFSLTHYNIRESNLYLPKKVQQGLEEFTRIHALSATSFVLIAGLAAIILFKYGNTIFAF